MSYAPTFSTEISDITRNNTVYVEMLNAFADPVAGKISLVNNAQYTITQSIDFDTDGLLLPDSSQITLTTINPTANIISSSLTGTDPFLSGSTARLALIEVTIISDTGAGVFHDIAAGVGIVPFVGIVNSRIQNFASIGTVDGGSFAGENVGYLLNDAGITFNDAIVVTMAEIAFFFQSGDHMTFTGTLVTGSFDKTLANPSTGDAVFNFDPGLDITNKVTIRDSFFSTAAGGTLFAAGSLDQTDPKIVCFNNGNELDSYWAGVFGFLDNAVETEIDFVDTYTDIEGVIVAGLSNERFTLSDGVWTYIGEETIKAIINVNMSLKKALGASARTVRVALFTDTGSGFVENGSAPLDMDNNIKSFGFTGLEVLNKGDRQKLMIKNETNTDNVLIVTYDVAVHKA